MREIGIGIIGGGYMGKAHAVAMSAVGAVFNTELRPRLEMVCASSAASAERYRQEFGFKRATDNWQDLVNDPEIEAVIIASPQSTHESITLAACAAGKHVFCEKPLGDSIAASERMIAAAEAAGIVHMIGFNYSRTPATQYAVQLLKEGAIGTVHYFRAEHAEDFLSDPNTPTSFRTDNLSTGTLGDLAPHLFNCAMTLLGPIKSISAIAERIISHRPNAQGEMTEVKNDDQVQMMCRFENGVSGQLFASRIAAGRKMGYAYEIHGSKGSIRFDQEDQNALWLYQAEGPEAQRGFKKILTGPAHPNYLAFCQGPGHGTGYQDQIIIEARDFLEAVAENKPRWPTFYDGLASDRAVYAAFESSESNSKWVDL